MGELFVRESDFESDRKYNQRTGTTGNRKKGSRKSSRKNCKKVMGKLSILTMKLLRQVVSISTEMNWLQGYGQINMLLKIHSEIFMKRLPMICIAGLHSEIHRIELKYKNPLPEELIYNILKDFKYIVPQGGPMTGIGNDYQIASLSNCFVIGNDGDSDSYGGIMKIDQEQVQLMKRRGGVGHDLSHIRPKGTPVLNSALTSTGVVPFMERYSNSTREVAQDGRRGASDAINFGKASRFRKIYRCKT